MVREATVIAGDAHITVSRQPPVSVTVKVETNAGTFVVTGDSEVVALWADSAQALPEPSTDAIKKKKATLRSWMVRGLQDTATKMRLMRVPGTKASDVQLSLSNGAWGTFELLGTEQLQVFAALRGQGLDTTDTAHVHLTSRPAVWRPCATVIGVLEDEITPDTGCTKPRVEEQASLRSGEPSYPSGALASGRTGEVLIEFVVDTTGRADRRTVCLLRFSQADFAFAVWRAMDWMRFSPAKVDGHVVKELVQQPFIFAIRGRGASHPAS